MPRNEELMPLGKAEHPATQFPAELCFGGAVTPQGIVAGLLETYSAPQAYVICKRWAELFAGSSKIEGAVDLLKDRAINGTTQKMMNVEIGGRVVAYMNEKNLPAKWEYEDETLAALEESAKVIKTQIDERKKMLQALKAEVADTHTGEMLKPAKKVSAGVTVAVEFVA